MEVCDGVWFSPEDNDDEPWTPGASQNVRVVRTVSVQVPQTLVVRPMVSGPVESIAASVPFTLEIGSMSTWTTFGPRMVQTLTCDANCLGVNGGLVRMYANPETSRAYSHWTTPCLNFSRIRECRFVFQDPGPATVVWVQRNQTARSGLRYAS